MSLLINDYYLPKVNAFVLMPEARIVYLYLMLWMPIRAGIYFTLRPEFLPAGYVFYFL
jgi:hypothetical protein